MKEYKSCTLLLAPEETGVFLNDNECQIECELENETILDLHIIPMPPIYRSKTMTRKQKSSNRFISAEKLKIAG